MKIGLMTTPRESAADTVAVAQMAEARGIESIWLGEHSHLPTATKHAFHEETPDFYKRVPDPYVTLAAAATATERIRLGTAISLPAEHNPITLAKMIATLDHASGGRFDWGIGYGWNQLEMVNRGLDPLRRMATLREVVLAVRALWTSEVTSFDGKHVSFTELVPAETGASAPSADLARLPSWAPSIHSTCGVLRRLDAEYRHDIGPGGEPA